MQTARKRDRTSRWIVYRLQVGGRSRTATPAPAEEETPLMDLQQTVSASEYSISFASLEKKQEAQSLRVYALRLLNHILE